MGCGAPIEASDAGPRSARAPAGGTPARTTVLFADVSGSTAVAERMDPEAVKALVDRAAMRLGQEVTAPRRNRRQVHRRQRDGDVRSARGARGRRRAGGAAPGWPCRRRWARSTRTCARPTVHRSTCASASNTGEVAGRRRRDEAYTVIGDTVNVAAQAPERRPARQRDRRGARRSARRRGAVRYEQRSSRSSSRARRSRCRPGRHWA